VPGGRDLRRRARPDGGPNAKYNKADTAKGHDHTFFVQLSRDVFAD
jgi:hypothetical protein